METEGFRAACGCLDLRSVGRTHRLSANDPSRYPTRMALRLCSSGLRLTRRLRMEMVNSAIFTWALSGFWCHDFRVASTQLSLSLVRNRGVESSHGFKKAWTQSLSQTRQLIHILTSSTLVQTCWYPSLSEASGARSFVLCKSTKPAEVYIQTPEGSLWRSECNESLQRHRVLKPESPRMIPQDVKTRGGRRGGGP